MKYQKILDEVYNEIINEENKGKVASYIPELAKVDPSNFGIHLTNAWNMPSICWG